MSVEKMSEGSSGSDVGNPVHHVSIKPPPFMETAVAGWFAVMDAQFHIANVKTESTKFYHVFVIYRHGAGRSVLARLQTVTVRPPAGPVSGRPGTHNASGGDRHQGLPNRITQCRSNRAAR